MTSPNYYLAREIEQARAKHKPISIEIPAVEAVEGQHEGYPKKVVEVVAPQLWSDDISIAAQVNPVQGARMLLGDADYEHWQAAGASAGILFEIMRKHAGAASLGESPQS